MRHLFSLVLSVALLLSVGCAHAQTQGEAPAPELYVCNQGEATISVVDMESQSVEATIDLKERGFSENAKPHHAVAEPDGSHWYVTLIGENTILKFNRQNEIVGRVSFEVPGLLSLHPSNGRLYAGRSMSAVNPPQSVAVVDRSDMELLNEAGTFFPRPHPIAARSSGDYIVTASLAANQLMAMNTETDETELTRLGGEAQTLVQFATTPEGNTMIAGGQGTGQLLVFDLSSAPSITVTDTIGVGQQPWHPVISADGSTAYVPNKASNSISVVDLESRTVTATIEGEGLAQPHGTALAPDGRYLFVSNNNRNGTYTSSGQNPDAGTITVIDTRTNEIVKVIEVGTYPSGIGTLGGQRAVS